MFIVISMAPIVVALLWLLSIRPYCRRNGKGYTPGGTIAVTFWIDWQEAKEISAAKGDRGMTMICYSVLWLQILFFGVIAFVLLSP